MTAGAGSEWQVNELACTLIFVFAWLAMAGYMNYKIWLKPDDVWQIRHESAAQRPGRSDRSLFRFLRFDPFHFGDRRGRFIWFERVVAGVLLLIGILMLAGVIRAAFGL